MKERLLLFCLFAIILSSFAAAAIAECAAGDDACQIDNGYSCLNDEISNKTCSNLGSEEKVFSLLATGKCSSEVKDDSKYKSDIKYTSQTILGMQEAGSVNSDAKSWLFSKNRTTDSIDWFLEIESPNQTTCTVSYSSSNTITINDDKTINSVTGGSCLTKSTNGYWIKIDQGCFDEEFEVSCDRQFLTTLLYKSQNSDTIYVSEKASSASAGGTAKEKVGSLCFSGSGSSGACNYEETLWAALALNAIGVNVSDYIPYLVTQEFENEDLLPEAFLYRLTSNVEFKNQLLAKQINNKWWELDQERYFGTALALMPLQYEEPQQKKDSLNWLLNEAQEESGCWNSENIRDTAFLLYSISPRATSGISGSSCIGSGFFCLSQINCQGNVLPGYSCSGAFVCCAQDLVSESCSVQGGEICSPSQNCVGVNSVVSEASGLGSGEICCLQGTCQNQQTSALSECETLGGSCRPSSCLDNEQKTSNSCTFSGDICCIPKTKSGISLWIWVLLLLIVLAVLGIIYRDKLRPYWFMMRSKFQGDKGPASGSIVNSGPRSPPGFGPMPPTLRRPIQMQRHGRGTMPRRSPRARSQGEIDEVLKKLKEIGK